MNSLQPDTAPAEDFFISAFGAVPGDTGNNQTAIQSAIDACALAGGGGRVVVPAGRWVSGSLRLRSGVELHLAQDAILAASPDEGSFPVLAKTDNLPGVIRALVWADGAERISITGPGTLYGGGDSALWGEEAAQTFFRPALVFLRNCRRILLQDARLHYSQYWTCHLLRCSDVVIDAIDIRTHPGRINADGIDPDGCRNVRISNCQIESADDALCLKSTEGDPCEDIVVTNCILSSQCAAIKLGTESIGPIREVHIENCIVRDSNMGIALYQKDGGGFHSISMRNIGMQCRAEFPILIDTSRRWRSQERVGEVRAVLLENVRCTGPGKMMLRGHPQAPLREIILKSVSFLITGPLDFPLTGQPTGARRSEPDPAHTDDWLRRFQGIIVHASGVRLEGVSVADERTTGIADRGIAYLRACVDVTGRWSHGANWPPGRDGEIVVEDSEGISLAGPRGE